MSVEEAVADLHRRQTSLRQEIQRDVQSALNDLAKNKRKFDSHLKKFNKEKEKVDTEPLQQRLDQLQETKKTICDLAQNIRTQILASSSPNPVTAITATAAIGDAATTTERNSGEAVVERTIMRTPMTLQDQQPASGFEEAVANLRQQQTSLQQEIHRDVQSVLDELAQNNRKLTSNLKKFYGAKEKIDIGPLQQRLDQLQDTKKTIRDITDINNITKIIQMLQITFLLHLLHQT